MPSDPSQNLRHELELLRRDFIRRAGEIEMRIVELEEANRNDSAAEPESLDALVHNNFPESEAASIAEKLHAAMASDDSSTESSTEASKTHEISNQLPKNETETDILSSQLAEAFLSAQQEAKATSLDSTPLVSPIKKSFETPQRKLGSEPKVSVPPKPAFSFLAFVLGLFGPFGELVEQYFSAYGDYKKQGKGPVFLMTSAGVVILTFGFIYLLQYSFNNLLDATGRVALGYVFSSSVLALGYHLSKGQRKTLDYGSALLGCGVTLMYVSTFFAHSWYGLLSSEHAFVVLGLTTAMSLLMAFRFHARIVSVLSLIGGALTPLIIPEHVDNSHLYLYYLSLLGASGLWLSYRIAWSGLTHLWLILVAGVLELLFRNPLYSEWLSCDDFVLTLHLLFYGFVVYGWKALRREGDRANSHIVFTLVGALCLTLASLYRSSPPYLGWCFAFNGLPFVLLFGIVSLRSNWSSLTKKCYQSLCASMAVMWLACAIFVLAAPEALGMMWCSEALLLLFLGCCYELNTVRKEAWSFLGMACLTILSEVLPWLSTIYSHPSRLNPDLIFQVEGLALIFFGVVSALTLVLCRIYRDRLETWEHKFYAFCMNVSALWFALTFFWLSSCIWLEGTLLFSVIPMFILLLWAKKSQQAFIEFLAVIHFPMLLLQLFLSAQQVHSFHFEAQTLVGKIARVESFVTLWALAFFYRRFYGQGAFASVANLMYHVFYLLIPVFWLPGPIRHFTAWTGMWLWLAWSIALLLYVWKGLKSLLVEFYILSAAAGVFALVSVWLDFPQLPFHRLEALVMGGLCYGILYQLAQRSERWPKFRSFSQHSPYSQWYWGCALAGMTYLALDSYTWASLTFLAWNLVVLLWKPNSPSIAPWLGMYCALPELLCFGNLIGFMVAVLLRGHLHESLELHALGSLLSCGAWGFLLHHPTDRALIYRQKKLHSQRSLWFFNADLAIFYALVMLLWFPEVSKIATSMLLVFHATALLLLSIKPLYGRALKLPPALFLVAAIKILCFDLAGYSLAQKVIAFMVIGVLLLLAAWMYQKMKDHRLEQPLS